MRQSAQDRRAAGGQGRKRTAWVFGRDYTMGRKQCSGSRERQREARRDDGAGPSLGYASSLGLERGTLPGAVPGNEAGERPHLDHEDCLPGRDAPEWVSSHLGKLTLVVKCTDDRAKAGGRSEAAGVHMRRIPVGKEPQEESKEGEGLREGVT